LAKNPVIDFRFDDKAAAAQAAAERQAAQMVVEITKETEANIRSLISQALREGIPPYEAAEAIQDMIGLTSAQGQAALKYRQQLVKNGLTPEQVNAKTEKYADELLTLRAETIARSEIMDALNTGQDEAWKQAQEEGLLSENATKVWITTPDELLCPICEPLDGQTVPIGDEFPDGDPPAHPNCRCTIGIEHP
jgi:SPP1 gp7 family putative phage head morphogenesis protein